MTVVLFLASRSIPIVGAVPDGVSVTVRPPEAADDAALPSEADTRRARQVIPRSHWRGGSPNHASAQLNARLLASLGRTMQLRACESFGHGELDSLLLVLAGSSAAALGEIYEERSDNRRLPSAAQLAIDLRTERAELLHLRETNHSLGIAAGEMARQRKCTQAVMRYAHHLSERRRARLQQHGVWALPMLPRCMECHTAPHVPAHTRSATNESAASRIYHSWKRAMQAIDCHVEVNEGCPGGSFDACLSVCPGVPDAPPALEDACRETCADTCGFSKDDAQRDGLAPAASSSSSSDGHPTSSGDAGRLPASTTPATGRGNASRPEPPFWGDRWQVIMSRNSTNADGSDGGFRACIRWYDWTSFAARTDCTRDGATSTTLTVRGAIYSIFPGPPGCVVSDIGITPVAPYWLQEGAEYLGTDVVNGVAVEVWDKREGPGGDSHIYAVASDDQRPVQMLTTGPDLGQGRTENQKDYINCESTCCVVHGPVCLCVGFSDLARAFCVWSG
jgi:hypothetical protein